MSVIESENTSKSSAIAIAWPVEQREVNSNTICFDCELWALSLRLFEIIIYLFLSKIIADQSPALTVCRK